MSANYPEYDLAWVAVDGDCGPAGMGTVGEVIVFGAEHYELVRDYLRAAHECAMCCYFDKRTDDGPMFSEAYLDAMRRHEDSGNALIDAGVFAHKYHKRTEWSLTEAEVVEGWRGLTVVRV